MVDRDAPRGWPRPAFAAVLACAALPCWPLDLSQAYQAALEQDATFRAARASAEARRERLPQARAQLLPNVSANMTRNRNNLDRTAPNLFGQPATSHLHYTGSTEALTVRQPIFRKYQLADYLQAQAQVEEANATLEKDLQNVGVRVSGAYFEALLAQDQLTLVLAQKTAYMTQLDAARKRLSAGAGTRTDIDEAQAALDLNTAQELEARQNVDFTRRQLQAIVNQPIDSLAGLDPRKLILRSPDPARVEDWTLRAEQNSPEIQALKAQLEAARHEIEKAKAGHYPTLDAIAQWSRNENDSVTTVDTRYTNRAIGLQLVVPIFSGGHTSSLVRQAVAEQERVEHALEALRRELGVRIHREFRGITEGVLKVKALEQAVRSAEQVAVSSRRAYEAGSRTLLDTLNAEQQRVAALRDLAHARYLYLMSRVRLLSVAGGPKGESIDEINGYLTH